MSNGMREPAWEGTMCIICDYWWLLLLVIVGGVGAYFGQKYL